MRLSKHKPFLVRIPADLYSCKLVISFFKKVSTTKKKTILFDLDLDSDIRAELFKGRLALIQG